MEEKEQYYFYANGERHSLELDRDNVAIDVQPLEPGTRAHQIARDLVEGATNLRRGVYLIARQRLSESEEAELAKAGVIQPVFRHCQILLVALPEIRVEASRGTRQKDLRLFLNQPQVDAEVVRDQGEQLTIRPRSGSGLDALKLANRLQEEVEPELAQVRFLRLVRQPTEESE